MPLTTGFSLNDPTNSRVFYRNNLTAVTDPGTSNDATQGYGPTSQWFNHNTGVAWTCIDDTPGAAVWSAGGGGGGGGNVETETGTSPIKISAFPGASLPMGSGDTVTGIQGGVNVNFTQAQILSGIALRR